MPVDVVAEDGGRAAQFQGQGNLRAREVEGTEAADVEKLVDVVDSIAGENIFAAVTDDRSSVVMVKVAWLHRI